MELFNGSSHIFADKSVMSPEWKPPELPGRKKQINKVAANVRDLIDGIAPHHTLIKGQSGTGKTASVRYVLDELKKRVGDSPIAYVVSGESAYRTCVSLAKGCGCDIPSSGKSLDYTWDTLEKYLDGKPTLFVIDEVDKMMRKNGEELLYFLSRSGNIGTVCITNKVDAMDNISDVSVQSSYTPMHIRFEVYDSKDLEEILEARREIAFRNGAVEEGVIEFCAAKTMRTAPGDARYAIDLLYYAGVEAENYGRDKVVLQDVQSAETSVDLNNFKEDLVRLQDAHKKLLLCILKSGNKTKSEIWDIYNTVFGGENDGGHAPRSLRRFASKLENEGFVRSFPKGRGRAGGQDHFFEPADRFDEVDMIEILVEDLELNGNIFKDI